MGRSSLLMVMGFNIVFAIMGFNLSKTATDAYDNYVSYYNRSVARHIASSAANMAASAITFTPNWRDGYSNISFGGGTFSCTMSDLDSGRIKATITSNYYGVAYASEITLGLSKFSKFAYYSMNEGGIYFANTDSVFGPIHTQDKLYISGSTPGPTFMGKATSKLGIQKQTPSAKPNFLGGYQSGVDIALPTDLSNMRGIAKTAAPNNGKYFSKQNIFMEFKGDGTVTWRVGSWTASATTELISTFAPNGVMVADSANIHVKGVMKGQLTITALRGAVGSGTGKVRFDSSVVYKDNPLAGPSTDMLGIVADDSLIIADNANNNDPSKGVNIHATMLSKDQGLGAEHHSTRPIAGALTLLGGIQQKNRNAVGTLSGGSINHGFRKNYRYDDRLLVTSPPSYPNTGAYEVLSWFE